jgi:hypothetical protein
VVRASVASASFFVFLCSPCWCGLGVLLIRGQYLHWFVYTAEDRAFFRDRREYQEGVPSAARRLKAEMEAVPDPDSALAQHPDWFAARCVNGEWVFGYGINSHGLRSGHGTLVLKDSRGRIRIYFGHVCGTNAGLDWLATVRTLKTLDDFYAMLSEQPYLREWTPDP